MVYTNNEGFAKFKSGLPFKAWSRETSVSIDHQVYVPWNWKIYKTPSDEKYTDRFTVAPI